MGSDLGSKVGECIGVEAMDVGTEGLIICLDGTEGIIHGMTDVTHHDALGHECTDQGRTCPNLRTRYRAKTHRGDRARGEELRLSIKESDLSKLIFKPCSKTAGKAPVYQRSL